MNSELRSVLESLRLCAWLTCLLFVMYFASSMLKVEQSMRTLTARGYIADGNAAMTVLDWTVLVSFNLFSSGLPALITALAARAAGSALAGSDMSAIVNIVVWSRRFLILSSLWLAGFVVLCVLLALRLAS